MSQPAKEVFERHLDESGLPSPIKELKFHPERKFAFDYAWPEYKLAFEIEGGAFSRGRHVRPKGFTRDIEKYNDAQLMGWVVLRGTSEQVKQGMAIKWVLQFFSNELDEYGELNERND